MQALSIPGAYVWSRWQPERHLQFNAHLFIRPEGNVAVDPLALDEQDSVKLAELGGLAQIVVTNRDHSREAAALKERFGAQIVTTAAEAQAMPLAVDRTCQDGDEIFSGAFVVALQHQKSAGEFALHLRRERAVLVGDAVIGSPTGALCLLPDEKYADVRSAVLGLRRLLTLQPEVLLVGDGASIYGGATERLSVLLHARLGVEVNRINLDELTFESFVEGGGDYRGSDAEVGWWIGAEKLGYRVVTLPPGAKFCPLHSHALEEELFFVLEGEPSVRTPSGTLKCRRGDFIAFPTGDRGAHQLINQSASDATVLLLGMAHPNEIAFYPDSNKVLLASRQSVILRAEPVLEYYDGE